MESGAFTDKVRWLDWMTRLANIAPAEEAEEKAEE
jgi:hypothetical protein